MHTAISKLTTKYQTTVPEPVRKKLDLDSGDRVIFEIHDDYINLRKAQPMDIEFATSLSSTLGEWNSLNDEEAYDDLQAL